jgi:WXG100 family type VII secretion target
MTAPKIRADYEGLKKIAQSFSSESDQVDGMTKNVQSNVDTLRGGDWVGPGATAFYQEMDSAVFPGLKRLSAALGEAARASTQINQLINGAERDAAAVLRSNADADTRQKSGDSGSAPVDRGRHHWWLLAPSEGWPAWRRAPRPAPQRATRSAIG